jgi:hypothetical protein
MSGIGGALLGSLAMTALQNCLERQRSPSRLVVNLPTKVTTLLAGLPLVERLMQLGNAIQGTNHISHLGWFGPQPPAGDSPPRYHFQVFALDRATRAASGLQSPGAPRSRPGDGVRQPDSVLGHHVYGGHITPSQGLLVGLIGLIFVGLHGLQDTAIAGKLSQHNFSLGEKGFGIALHGRLPSEISHQRAEFPRVTFVIILELDERRLRFGMIEPVNRRLVSRNGIKMRMDDRLQP